MAGVGIVVGRSPLEATVQRSGVRLVEVSGWRLPQGFSSIEMELMAARHNVALADQSASGKLLVEGHEASAVLRSIWDLPELAVGAGAQWVGGHGFCLRPDLLFVHTQPGALIAWRDELLAYALRAPGLVTVTDVTHGWAELCLLGPASGELLSRLCGLDFRASAFPNLAAKQSSVAKTTQLVVRRDMGALPAYSLIGDRSLAAFLWKTILRAGQDLGIRPVGQEALEETNRSSDGNKDGDTG